MELIDELLIASFIKKSKLFFNYGVIGYGLWAQSTHHQLSFHSTLIKSIKKKKQKAAFLRWGKWATRQAAWNGRGAGASLEWNCCAAEGWAPSHNPRKSIKKAALRERQKQIKSTLSLLSLLQWKLIVLFDLSFLACRGVRRLGAPLVLSLLRFVASFTSSINWFVHSSTAARENCATFLSAPQINSINCFSFVFSSWRSPMPPAAGITHQ